MVRFQLAQSLHIRPQRWLIVIRHATQPCMLPWAKICIEAVLIGFYHHFGGKFLFDLAAGLRLCVAAELAELKLIRVPVTRLKAVERLLITHWLESLSLVVPILHTARHSHRSSYSEIRFHRPALVPTWDSAPTHRTRRTARATCLRTARRSAWRESLAFRSQRRRFHAAFAPSANVAERVLVGHRLRAAHATVFRCQRSISHNHLPEGLRSRRTRLCRRLNDPDSF